MKRQFFEYYQPTAYSFKKIWNKSIIIFDANVLLDLYRMQSQLASKLLVILNKIRSKLWLPHQVALEFSRDRLHVKSKLEQPFGTIKDILTKSLDSINKTLDEVGYNPLLDLEEVREITQDGITVLKQKILDMKPKWKIDDKVLMELDSIFSGKIGAPYSEGELVEIYKTGGERYEKDIPPGYKDKDKDKLDKTKLKKFGDYIIWRQIIDFAKKKKLPIIFITSDMKEDWWQYVDGKFIGPLPSLRREIYKEASVQFFMYKLDDFIEMVNKKLNIDIEQKLIDELKEIIEQDRKYQIKQQLSVAESFSPASMADIIGSLPFDRVTESVEKNITTNNVGETSKIKR